jgi:hypothetical protein
MCPASRDVGVLFPDDSGDMAESPPPEPLLLKGKTDSF